MQQPRPPPQQQQQWPRGAWQRAQAAVAVSCCYYPCVHGRGVALRRLQRTDRHPLQPCAGGSGAVTVTQRPRSEAARRSPPRSGGFAFVLAAVAVVAVLLLLLLSIADVLQGVAVCVAVWGLRMLLLGLQPDAPAGPAAPPQSTTSACRQAEMPLHRTATSGNESSAVVTRRAAVSRATSSATR